MCSTTQELWVTSFSDLSSDSQILESPKSGNLNFCKNFEDFVLFLIYNQMYGVRIKFETLVTVNVRLWKYCKTLTDMFNVGTDRNC